MKASEISISSMKSSSECYTAIDKIWNDHRNCLGGISAFMSGKQTYLTNTAKKKVDALERKAASFCDMDDTE
jgi:hypothetical protein